MTRTRVCFLAILLPAHAAFGQPPAAHEKETTAAWEAFKGGKFAAAITHADACINGFQGPAGRRQKEIADAKEVVPIGLVLPAQKAAIHNNGPLNDVATAHFIKARAAYKLGKKAEVLTALAETEKYSAARVWDPKGWFWSPADAARLFRLNPELADKPLHEAYVSLAWAALNRRDHAKAIELADKCTAGFRAAAEELENDLARRGVQLPVGAVGLPARNVVFENGVLNDAATAFFIKGKAAEGRGGRKTAVAAYAAAASFPHARCWGESGGFWSPAVAAGDRLAALNIKK
ncbi:MAG TPA: hypothetical protein VD866_10430 [Urbifossiella sp.]|nr:hypothetical protein [Urbifossiella sp.]